MQKIVTIFKNKMVPVWLAVILLVGAGTGAAVGTILAGKITGEIPVAVGLPLLVGQPLFNELRHTPNQAGENGYLAIVIRFSDVISAATYGAEFTDAKYDAISYKDSSTACTSLSASGNITQQAFKFYVGPENDITRIQLQWTGYSTSGKPNGLAIMQGNTNATVATNDVPSSEETVTITLTSATDVRNAIDSNGYLYVNASSVTSTNETICTNYITVTTTYTALDWKVWAGFTGPQSLEHRFHVPKRFVGVHSADQTAFEAAAEVAVGDWYVFALPLKNASSNDLTAIMTLDVPLGLEVEVVSASQLAENRARVVDAVRIGLNTWKIIVKAGALKQDDKDYLYVVVSADAGYAPGYYTMTGNIVQVAY